MQFLKSKQNSSIFLSVEQIYESVNLNFFKKKYIEIIGEKDKNKKNISIFLKSKKKKSMQFKKIRTIYIYIYIYKNLWKCKAKE